MKKHNSLVLGNPGSELCLTRDKIDVIIIQCRAGEHSAMRVECSGGNGRGAIVVEEAGIRFKCRKVCTIDIKRLHLMAVRTPELRVSYSTQHKGRYRKSRTYMLKTGACS